MWLQESDFFLLCGSLLFLLGDLVRKDDKSTINGKSLILIEIIYHVDGGN
jgi:hypothetical protein